MASTAGLAGSPAFDAVEFMVVDETLIGMGAGAVLLGLALLLWLCVAQRRQLISARETSAHRKSRKPLHATAVATVQVPSEGDSTELSPADLDTALANGQFKLFYQPKVCAREGETVSVEALIRWIHPTKGFISPSEFIPCAEQSGRIRALTDWVLSQALVDQPRFAVPVYINISGPLLCDESFIDRALDMMRGVEATIGFEITETAVIQDPEHALSQLARLVEAQVPIAIDDYGAGLSSLIYLKQLPASELKIDQAFIRDISRSHRDPLLVRSTIDLAHALDMKVTAEGVEDAAGHALLRVMGCDYIQGYLTGRPMPAEQMEQHLAKGPQPIKMVLPGLSAQG